MTIRHPIAAALIGVALLAPQPGQAQAPSDRWTFSVAPYLWLPSVDGKLNYGPPPPGGSSPRVSIDADTLLENLDMAFMVMGEARRGRWLIATDVIYLDFGGSDSKVRSVDFNPGPGPINISTTSLNARADSKLTGWLWTLAGGYAAVQDPKWTLDVLGGFRYLSIDTETDWTLTAAVTGPGGTTPFSRTGSIKDSEDVWTAIVGAKGRIRLGESPWFVNYYADVGGASDVFTWQGMAGVGYAFKWGEVLLDYRYLYYSQSSDKLIDNLSFGGFGLGVNFRF